MTSRVYFLDNLRTFLIFLVIVYHAGFVFQNSMAGNWIVVDSAKADWLGLVGLYLDLFVMFILFFISGYFAPVSLQKKGSGGFLISKLKRIMLPWAIAVLTLIPAYKAIFLYSRGLPQEAWYSYFHFYQRAGADPGFFANDPSQHWLWFLPVLFLFQVLYVVLAKLKLLSFDLSMRTGVLLTFVVGLGYGMLISTLKLSGWSLTALLDFQRERLLTYFLVFLLGSLSYKHQVFQTRPGFGKLFIGANVGLTIGLGVYTAVALNLFFNLIEPGRNYFFVSQTVDRLAYHASMLLSMLSFLYIFLHGFQRSLDRRSPLWDRLNANSYYVYVIHMVVLGVVALALVNLPWPVFVKYLLLGIVTFVLCNLLISAQRSIFQKIFPAGPRE